MSIPLVDLKAQYFSLKDEIQAAINSVLSESAFIGGAFVESFENAFAAYCMAKHCVGVGNGTDAIHIALRAFGIGLGDEVITVANSFIATSEAITLAGATVVFVDCDPKTYNIDAKLVESAITSKTKAIVAVHLYGLPCDMLKLKELSKRYNLILIEDAAQAHGASINGRCVGTLGHAACFSFYPGKNLGAYGDAGAIVTNDADIAKRCRMLANHGRITKYDHQFEALNSRLDAVQAAILTCKLNHLEKWTKKRRAVASIYNENLNKNSNIVTINPPPNYRHVYHLYVVRLKERDKTKDYLQKCGITTGIHYPISLPNLKAYRYLGLDKGAFPNATRLSGEILSLPMFPEITNKQIKYIVYHLNKITQRL